MSSNVPRGWLRLVVPRDNTSAPFTAEQLYAAIHAGTGRGESTQIVLVGAPGDVGIWLRAEAHRLDPLAAMVRATYPDAELERVPPPWPRLAAGAHLMGARWSLAQEAAYPIKTVRAFEHSEPMAMTLGALAEARDGEFGVLSLVLTRAPGRFARRSLALQRALATGGDTGPLWQRAALLPLDAVTAVVTSLVSPASPETVVAQPRPLLDADLEARLKWVAGKVAQPAFAVTLRTAWIAPTASRAAGGHAGSRARSGSSPSSGRTRSPRAARTRASAGAASPQARRRRGSGWCSPSTSSPGSCTAPARTW